MFTVRYHPHVVKKDIPTLSSTYYTLIKHSIEQKLMESPGRYSLALRGDLSDFRKLRVGDYQVIFSIVSTTIYILTISHRKDAYLKAYKRV